MFVASKATKAKACVTVVGRVGGHEAVRCFGWIDGGSVHLRTNADADDVCTCAPEPKSHEVCRGQELKARYFGRGQGFGRSVQG